MPVATVPHPASRMPFATSDAGDKDKAATAWIEFQSNGTLVVRTDRSVCAIDESGRGRCLPVPKEPNAFPLSDEGLVVDTKDGATLYATPSLDKLFTGEDSGGGIVHRTTDKGTSIAMQIGGKLVVFALPRDPESSEILHALRTASDKYVIATFERTKNALVYEVATSKLVGSIPPLTNADGLPLTRIQGDRIYAIERGQLSILELSTTHVLRKKTIPCGDKEIGLGNPLASPSGERVLVTCGWDGLLLDGKTLNVIRRFSEIFPGARYGHQELDLWASFDETNEKELVIRGDQDESRLNLSTGRYRCLDASHTGGAFVIRDASRNKAPSGRESLPKCTSEEEQLARISCKSFNAAGTIYRLEQNSEEPYDHVLHGPGVRISLDACRSDTIAMAVDASRVACVEADSVVVRALPKGDEVARFKPE